MQIGLLKTCRVWAGRATRAGRRTIAGFAADTSGATVIDYALLAGLLALAAVEGFQIMGNAVADMFDMIAEVFVQSLS